MEFHWSTNLHCLYDSWNWVAFHTMDILISLFLKYLFMIFAILNCAIGMLYMYICVYMYSLDETNFDTKHPSLPWSYCMRSILKKENEGLYEDTIMGKLWKWWCFLYMCSFVQNLAARILLIIGKCNLVDKSQCWDYRFF